MEKRNWLIEARTEKQLSRSQVADAAELHETYIEKIENGNRTPSVAAAIKIGKALDIPAEDIVNRFVSERLRRAAV